MFSYFFTNEYPRLFLTKTRTFIRGKNKVDQIEKSREQLCDVFIIKNKICHILKHSLEHFFKPTHIWLPVEFYYYIILLWWLTKILHFAYRTPLHNWLEIGKKVPTRNFSVSQFCSIMIILISVQLTVYLLNRVNAISVL